MREQELTNTLVIFYSKLQYEIRMIKCCLYTHNSFIVPTVHVLSCSLPFLTSMTQNRFFLVSHHLRGYDVTGLNIFCFMEKKKLFNKIFVKYLKLVKQWILSFFG